MQRLYPLRIPTRKLASQLRKDLSILYCVADPELNIGREKLDHHLSGAHRHDPKFYDDFQWQGGGRQRGREQQTEAHAH